MLRNKEKPTQTKKVRLFLMITSFASLCASDKNIQKIELNLGQINSVLKELKVNEYEDTINTEDTINRKCLNHIIEQCNHDEEKLTQICNTFLPQTKQTLLNHLIQTNSFDELIHDNIMYLVEHKADLNLENKNGNTLIHLYLNDRKYYEKAFNYAKGAKQQYLSVSKKGEFHRHATTFFDHINFFIKNSGNFSKKNNNGQTPLHMGFAFFNVPGKDIYFSLKDNDLIDTLLIEDKNKRIPLIKLAENLSFDVIEFLISDKKIDQVKDARSQNNVLHSFVRNRPVVNEINLYEVTEETAEKALTYQQIKRLMEINKELLCQNNKQGKSALDIMCYDLTEQQRSDLKKYLTIDVDLENITDEDNNTFIHRMCYEAKFDADLTRAFKALNNNKKLLETKNKFGKTPLHLAFARHRFLPTYIYGTNDRICFIDNPSSEIEALMSKNLLDIKDQDNNTVFYTALHALVARSGLSESTKLYWINYFLSLKPSLDQANIKGNAPIHKIMQIVDQIGSHTIDNNTIRFNDDWRLSTITIENINTLLKIKNKNSQVACEYVKSKLKEAEILNFMESIWYYAEGPSYYKNKVLIRPYRTLEDLFELRKHLIEQDFVSKKEFYQRFREKLVEALDYVIRKNFLYKNYNNYTSEWAHAVHIMTKLFKNKIPKPVCKKIVTESIPSPLVVEIKKLLDIDPDQLKGTTFKKFSEAFSNFTQLKRLKIQKTKGFKGGYAKLI